ncbi:hypothetical protein AAW02_09815 [Aeromonas dhakensis]|nr:hypothetical protein AAW03_16540 [Aeromonas dhakensis]PHS88187.1 hypothetical protein AAW02_09815 [Aeromonas dhakensis]
MAGLVAHAAGGRQLIRGQGWGGMDVGRLINQAARIGLEQQGEFFLKTDNKYRSRVHFTCLHILIQI